MRVAERITSSSREIKRNKIFDNKIFYNILILTILFTFFSFFAMKCLRM